MKRIAALLFLLFALPVSAAQITSGMALDARYLGIGSNNTLAAVALPATSNTSVPAGNTAANTTAFIPLSSTYTIPANSLSVGDVVKIDLWGVYSTNTIAPNITGTVKLNGTTVFNTGALSTVAGDTNAGWSCRGSLIVMSIGPTGTLDGQAFCEFSTAVTTSLSVNVPNTSLITLDTTQDQVLTVGVQWSNASPNNSFTMRQMIVRKN